MYDTHVRSSTRILDLPNSVFVRSSSKSVPKNLLPIHMHTHKDGSSPGVCHKRGTCAKEQTRSESRNFTGQNVAVSGVGQKRVNASISTAPPPLRRPATAGPQGTLASGLQPAKFARQWCSTWGHTVTLWWQCLRGTGYVVVRRDDAHRPRWL